MPALRHRHLRGLLCLAAFAVFTACSDTESPGGPDDFDATELLADVPSQVIFPTYVDLEAQAEALNVAVVALGADLTDPNLEAARDAWRETRVPWEQSEGFLFGPVDTEGIDPSIDSWPVNVADLNAVLASGDPLTKESIDALEGTLKGFHTIEYLLFGVGGTKVAADFTERELEYLDAVTQSLVGAVNRLREAWDPAGDDFSGTVATAGEAGNTVYTSQSQAVQEIINGLIVICDEVGNGKISDPFDQQDRSLEESQFSDNSNADFADNIRSVRNIYLGGYDGRTGTGVQALVQSQDADLDETVVAQIDAAIAAIEDMTPTFGEAITENPTAVEAARTAIGALRQTLESEVLPLAQ
jgi:putative iron-regulated protein